MFYKDHLKLRLYSYPICFLIGLVGSKTFLSFILDSFRIWIHEFGHAFMSWISGMKALPLAFVSAGITFGSADKSFWFYIVFSLSLFIIASYGKRKSSPYLFNVSLILLIITFVTTWMVPLEKTRELITLSGFGGEIILSTFLIISFYFRFPKKFHWRYFFRWIALFIGFYSLTKTSLMWIEAKKTKSLAVFGVNFYDSGLMGVGGDLHRLMFDYKWDLSDFFSLYLGLLVISWVLIISIYLYFLKKKMTPDEFGVD